MVEESYFTANGATHAAPHLFLFTEQDGGVLLTSYDMPAGYDKDSFTYANLKPVAYADLKPSAKSTRPCTPEKDRASGEGAAPRCSARC